MAHWQFEAHVLFSRPFKGSRLHTRPACLSRRTAAANQPALQPTDYWLLLNQRGRILKMLRDMRQPLKHCAPLPLNEELVPEHRNSSFYQMSNWEWSEVGLVLKRAFLKSPHYHNWHPQLSNFTPQTTKSGKPECLPD